MEADSEIDEQNIPEIEDNVAIEEIDESVSILLRIKLFFKAHWCGVVCLLTPLLFIPVLAPFPPQKYQWCGYTLIIMAIYWVTECIPLSITSFLPIVIFPLTGVMNTNITCRCYMNDTIMMFLASMALAYAVEQSGLHNRLALCVVRAIGYSHYRLLFSLSFTTMFISMWITNTAATTMMVPINFALLKVFEDLNMLNIYETTKDDKLVASEITTCYFCSITYSATIGGIGTLVGTATNLVFKGLYERAFPESPEYLSFPFFSAFSIPLMFLLEISVYVYMICAYFGFLRPNSALAKKAQISEEALVVAKNSVEENWKKLGRITFWEIMVIILFLGAILLFFTRSPQIFPGWGDEIVDYFEINDSGFVLDSAAAMLIVFVMLSLPSTLDFFKNFTAKPEDVPTKSIPSVLNWTIMNEEMPYGFMFLLGGGFALSMAAKREYSDLNGQIGIALKSLEELPNYFIIFLIIIFTVFLTNFASNVAVANVIVPIVMQLGSQIDVHPLWYNITAGFCASFCFCLPVGTPGNLIVQSAVNIPTIAMMKTGAIPSTATIIWTWLCICFWAPVIWPDLTVASNYRPF